MQTCVCVYACFCLHLMRAHACVRACTSSYVRARVCVRIVTNASTHLCLYMQAS